MGGCSRSLSRLSLQRNQGGPAASRDAHAKQFNYDLDAICEDLRKREKASGQPTVSLPSKRIPQKKGV